MGGAPKASAPASWVRASRRPKSYAAAKTTSVAALAWAVQRSTRMSIGEVEVEVVRVAAPCRLLDDEIGPGAAAALRRRAGSVCRVLTSGTIRVGDTVELP